LSLARRVVTHERDDQNKTETKRVFMGDLSKIQATEGKVKISHDRYATSTPICQLTATTLKIPIVVTEFPDAGRGSTGSHATGRKLVSTDIPSYQRTEGGYKELNVLAKPE
jgi:hypothetical protein